MTENGCKQRKCPCRMWVNCLNYVDVQRQALRLKRKEYNFQEWYSENFRSDIKMADVNGNG